MRRMVAAIGSLTQHWEALRERPQVYRPSACLGCGLARFWRHGHYTRKADRQSPSQCRLDPTAILRFCCAGCGQTCSRLPGCLAPRRWYDWAVQQAVLLTLLVGTSVRRVSAALGPARSTLRRWRAWLERRHEVFSFHLRSRFAEWGRAADGPAFWRSALAHTTLAAAMSWLDQHLEVVP